MNNTVCQCSLEEAHWRIVRAVVRKEETDWIVSFQESVLFNHHTLETREVKQYSFERAYCTDTTWNHIISLRESVLCSHYIFDLAEQKLDQKEQELDQKLEISDLFAY